MLVDQTSCGPDHYMQNGLNAGKQEKPRSLNAPSYKFFLLFSFTLDRVARFLHSVDDAPHSTRSLSALCLPKTYCILPILLLSCSFFVSPRTHRSERMQRGWSPQRVDLSCFAWSTRVFLVFAGWSTASWSFFLVGQQQGQRLACRHAPSFHTLLSQRRYCSMQQYSLLGPRRRTIT